MLGSKDLCRSIFSLDNKIIKKSEGLNIGAIRDDIFEKRKRFIKFLLIQIQFPEICFGRYLIYPTHITQRGLRLQIVYCKFEITFDHRQYILIIGRNGSFLGRKTFIDVRNVFEHPPQEKVIMPPKHLCFCFYFCGSCFREHLSFITRLLKSLQDRKSTRLNSSHVAISYAVFCLKNK